MHPYTQLSLVIGWLLPSLVVGLVLAAITSRRLVAFGMAFLGGSIGWILKPGFSRVWPHSWEENLPWVLQYETPYAAGAAILLGGVIVVFDLVRLWRGMR